MSQVGIERFSFVNCAHHRGPFKKSLVDAVFLMRCIRSGNYDLIISLGNHVHDVLGHLGVAHHRLPHPSGRNRKLNDSKYVTRMLEDLRSAVCR